MRAHSAGYVAVECLTVDEIRQAAGHPIPQVDLNYRTVEPSVPSQPAVGDTADKAAVKAAVAVSVVPAERRPPYPSITIHKIPVLCLDVPSAREAVRDAMEDGRPQTIAYVNAHSLNVAYANEAYRSALRRTRLVLPDGIGIAIAARLKRQRFVANLNGTDFTPVILSLAAEQGWRVFFFGAAPGVAAQAADVLRERIPGLDIVGVRDGYGWQDSPEKVVDEIRTSQADIVIAALGNPLQELWLDQYLEVTGAKLGIGVGAFFDFTAGRVQRAPAWMNRFGVEWVWRLVVEPRRLWRRYLVGNPIFLWRAIWRIEPPA